MDLVLQLCRAAREGQPLKLTIMNNEVTWPAERVYFFDSVGDVDATFIIAEGTWIIPRKFNQGGYDLVVNFSDGNDGFNAVFVHVTRLDKHDIKCDYVKEMMVHLADGAFST